MSINPAGRLVWGALLAPLALAACRDHRPANPFPDAGRDVAPIVSDQYSTEDARDRMGEAEAVMAFAGLKPGMSVADVGAGEGYYTVRLAPAVGPHGRVLGEDIVAATRDLLAQRVQREALDNVAVVLGTPDNPRLPAASFDRIFLVHMYHEVEQPYAFLWHIAGALRPGGQVIVVDAERPVKRHGIPFARLTCEFRALGLINVATTPLEGSDGYVASFRAGGPPPSPRQILPCPSDPEQ